MHEVESLEVAVLCTFEALGPRYHPEACHVGISLTLAVGYLDPRARPQPAHADESLLEYLKPWLWTVDKLRAVRLSGPEKHQELQADLLPLPGNDTLARSALIYRLDGKLKRIAFAAGDSWALAWGNESVVKKDAVTGAYPWHAVLAQVSRYPAPLPRMLNLAMIGKTTRLDSGTSILAVPAFTLETPQVLGGKRLHFRPEKSGPCASPAGSNAPYSWSYGVFLDGEGEDARYEPVWRNGQGALMPLRFTAYVNRDTVPVSPADGKVWVSGSHGEPGWIKTPSGTHHSLDDDWRATLEPKLGEAFNLAQRLIDWMRWLLSDDEQAELKPPKVAERKSNLSLLAQQLEKIRFAVLATLFDLANGAPAKRWLVTGNQGPKNPEPWFPASSKEWSDLLSASLPELKDALDAPLMAWPKELTDKLSKPLTWTNADSLAIADRLHRELARLEQLQSSLAHEENLQRVVLAQWNKATKDDPLLLDKLRTLLGRYQLRSQLAAANLKAGWTKILLDARAAKEGGLTGAKTQVDILRESVCTALSSFAQDRLKQQPTGEAVQGYLGLDQDLSEDCRTSFRAFLQSWSAIFVAKVFPPSLEGPQQEGEDDTITPVPHAVTFPVGEILTSAPASNSDGLRKNTPPAMAQQITGFGALMREPGRLWRCLNLARANVDGAWLPQSVLVPMPLHRRNELANSFVTYNNQPLMAKSPAVRLAKRFELQGVPPAGAEKAGTDDSGRFLHYEYPLPDGDPHYQAWGKLPELRFRAGKESYEALLFTVSNAGALPPGLADPEDPTRLCADACLLPPADVREDSPWSQVRRPFSYRRKVPIGGIRVEQPAAAPGSGQAPVPGVGAKAEIHLPAIPADVLPRAREIDRQPSGRPAATSPRDRTLPLLLLDPWADRSAGSGLPSVFCFSVRKPAIDLDTWERWVSLERTPEMRPTRRLVWAAVHRQAAPGIDRVPLEDPAVSGLLFELCRPAPDGELPGHVGSRFVALRARTRAEPDKVLESLVAPAIAVRCEVAPADDGSLGPASTASEESEEIVVRVPQGQVFELRVHAVIDAAASERLAPGVRKLTSGGLATPEALQTAQQSAGAGAQLFSPFRLLIEVATDALPAPDQLFAAFSTRFKSDASSLVAEMPADGDFFRHLGRAELLRQVWRWNGRNLEPFRFPPAEDRHCQSALAAKLQLWEVEGFGDRPDDDHLVADFPRLVDPDKDGQRQPPVFRYAESLAGDLRAHYYRFAVRAYSRYEGILRRHPGAVFRDAHRVVSPRRPFVESLGTWHRCVVPCRRPQPVPKPGVRLVLPLTEAPGAPAETWESRSPGLLVVLDEPWFEVGGLAESLVAEVVTAKHSRESDGCDEQLLEMGPDPILSGEPARYDRDRENPEKIRDLIGPVGHTFDTSPTAALFVHSSFILPPPQGVQQDLDWYFVKVRFQRVLSGEGMEGGKPLTSDWTRGYWTQYLPPASLFEEAGGKGDVAHLRLDPSGGKLRLTDADGKPVHLRPEDAGGDSLFALYLIVTEVIRDATGHRKERYLRLMSQGKDNEWLKEIKNETGELGTRALRARVLEVQWEPRHPEDVPKTSRDSAPKASLWEQLFPAGEQQDAAARIVRISAPISELRPPKEKR